MSIYPTIENGKVRLDFNMVRGDDFTATFAHYLENTTTEEDVTSSDFQLILYSNAEYNAEIKTYTVGDGITIQDTYKVKILVPYEDVAGLEDKIWYKLKREYPGNRSKTRLYGEINIQL